MLNYALTIIRALSLPNVTYSLQKDGCTPVWWAGGFEWHPELKACKGVCGSNALMVAPVEPERLIVGSIGSQDCYPDYSLRYSMDCEADFDIAWHTMTAGVAVKLAEFMGCTKLVMIGHDAYVSGDTRRVEGTGLINDPNGGYYLAGQIAANFASEADLTVDWR